MIRLQSNLLELGAVAGEGKIQLSIVVPLYNEEDSVAPLYHAIVSAVDPLNLCYEILFVDDGSRDDTVLRARKLAENDRRLRILSFRRNYGQTPAMVAGIEHARGKILVTMDGDLQNDPNDIPLFIEQINQGHDIVVGWRHKRRDKVITRRLPSLVANWLIRKITGVPIKDNGCSLKAYRGDVIKGIPLYAEMHRFIPAMCSLAGSSIAEIKVNHHARRSGSSKYNLSRIYKVLLDLITVKAILSFAFKPLVGFAYMSAVAWLISSVSLLAGVWNNESSVVFFSLSILYASLAIILLFWGVLGELILRTGDVTPRSFLKVAVHSMPPDSNRFS
ncbi:MAG: glycosyltransferase family 2 protein [Gammaproteobacteria bacterium]